MKGERRGKRKTKFSKFDPAEPNPIFSKYSERREQWQTENKVFKFDMAELNHSCYKYNKEAESRYEIFMKIPPYNPIGKDYF